MECEMAGNTIHADLYITSTTTRYRRLWKRSISVGVLVTIKKKPSPSDVPLPPTPTAEQPRRTSSSQSHVAVEIHDGEDGEQLLRDTVDGIVKQKDWGKLRDFGDTQRVASIFRSDLERGLPDENPSQEAYNPFRARGFLPFLLKACSSYTIFLLLISAVLSLVTQMFERSPKYGFQEGTIILVAVFFLVTCPAVKNFLEEQKLEKKMLMKEKNLEVKVTRNGKFKLVAVCDVVKGDMVILEEGDRIPGDGLFVAGAGLVLDEVLDPTIDSDRNPFLSFGSKVIKGNGRMIVTSVGTNTSMGKVMSTVNHNPNQPNLLQSRIEKPNNYADKIALCISILITLVLFLRFLSKKHDGDDNRIPEMKGKLPVEELMKIFERNLLKPRGLVSVLASLTVVVLGFQHGMPLVITVSLGYWNEKVECVNELNANPQNLSAFGTMGFTTVICIDVSGGLTCNQMEVEGVNKFFIGEKEYNHGDDLGTSQVVLEVLQQRISVLMPENLKSPEDGLLNSWVQSKWGTSVEFSEESFSIIDSRRLSCDRKGSGVLMQKNDDENMHLHWKGSAKTILGMCSCYFDCGGKTHALENQKSKFEQVVKNMEDNGLIPIAFAYKKMEKTEVQEIREDGLILLALVGLKPCREEIKLALADLRSKGVSIKLVSGDELQKAKALAGELGIFKPDSNDVALEGEEFRQLNDDNRMKKIDEITVMGRSGPDEKLRMVQRLKKKGHVVAFYGGLTTGDTAALKEADIGITEKSLSTEMATESSDIVITSGRGLRSLTELLKYGRCVYCNIQIFIQVQLTACMSGLLITTIATICWGESPISAIQLVWVNFIVFFLGGTMMVMELPARVLITEQPQPKRTESVMIGVMWRNFIIQVLYQASVLLIFQFEGQSIRGMNKKVMESMIFNSFTLCQVFNLFNAMELKKKEVFLVVIRHHWFMITLVAVMVVHGVIVEFVAPMVGYARLDWVQWAFCFLIAVLSWGLDLALEFLYVFLSELSIGSVRSGMGAFLATTPSPHFVYMGLSFSMFLFFSCSYYFNTGTAQNLR
ncbi:calcium-transporting ATPase 12, plasma membrane-type-like [Cornus florida]|uniref:calcium-transporting ATPase 12, plasma membrane-type-like n=1 Tax=Cornus florida TaxID=4283 RepID=UPI00289631B4|nr:calcium-transporting ATPase 12, plasma membrane-type-like [Cornus florida]